MIRTKRNLTSTAGSALYDPWYNWASSWLGFPCARCWGGFELPMPTDKKQEAVFRWLQEMANKAKAEGWTLDASDQPICEKCAALLKSKPDSPKPKPDPTKPHSPPQKPKPSDA